MPLYDATGFFNPARARKDTTISKILESSPCIQEEFQEGDLVSVICLLRMHRDYLFSPIVTTFLPHSSWPADFLLHLFVLNGVPM